MRVSESTVIRNFLHSLENARARWSKASLEVSTGKKVNRPSDSPVDSARLIQIRDEMSKINQYYRNLDQARFQLASVDEALNSLRNLTIKVSERATYALTGTLEQQERDAIASELRQIRETMAGVASNRVNGNYLFSGTAVNTPPLELIGDTYVYQGNGEARYIEIAPGEKVQVNVTGIDAFLDPDTDLLNTLGELVNQLETSDIEGAKASLEKIQEGAEKLDVVRSRAGATYARLEQVQGRLDSDMILLTEQLSELEDADMADAISRLTMAETGLQ